MPAFTAIVRTDAAGGFDVSFPDLPGLKALADSRKTTPDAALLALLEHLKQMHAAGEAIPSPSTLKLSGSPGDEDGEAILVEI
jgi:predicted RNase H-like HicB family nuclease